MLTMQNLAAGSWTPLPNGNYKCMVREVGAYTAFDTDDLVDHWVNPVTGEKREIWQFAGGMLLITALATLLTQVDKLMLSRMLSPMMSKNARVR